MLKRWIFALALGLMMQAAAHADYYAFVTQANGNFSLLNLSSRQSTFIGRSQVYAGMAFGSDGSLYGMTSGQSAPSNFLRIDIASGQSVAIGSTGFRLNTLASLADGRLFGVDWSNQLISINPSTGVGTLVGPTGLPNLNGLASWTNSLASDGQSLFYTLSTNFGVGALYRLNLQTGAAAVIGSGGLGFSEIGGSVYAATTANDGQLFGFGTTGILHSVDLATGFTRAIGPTGLNNIFAGVGVVPEPSSALLLIGGIAVLGWRRASLRMQANAFRGR